MSTSTPLNGDFTLPPSPDLDLGFDPPDLSLSPVTCPDLDLGFDLPDLSLSSVTFATHLTTNLRFWPSFPREVPVGISFVAAVATKTAHVRGSASVPHVEGKRVQIQVVHADSDSVNDGLA